MAAMYVRFTKREKNIPQLMFQYAYFKLIFYQQFKRLTFHWH